jgi:hypothetical protein
VNKIIPGFDKATNREVRDCRISCYKDVLAYYGIPLSAHVISLLAGGIGFQFGRFVFEDLPEMDLWLAGGLVVSLEDELTNNLHLRIEKHIICGKQGGFDELKKYIDLNIPLLVEYDHRYISGEQKRPSPLSVLNIHYSSYTILIGYDTGKNIVYLVQNNDNKNEISSVNLDIFTQARNQKLFPISQNNICYCLNIDKSYVEWLNINMPNLLLRSLLSTANRMLGDGSFSDDRIDATVLESAQSIAGMRQFCGAIRIYQRELSDQEKIYNIDTINKLFVVKFLVLRSFFVQNSNTCNREEFGKGLVMVSEQMDLPFLSQIGEGFIRVAVDWRNLMRMIFHVKDMCHKKREFIEEVAGKMSYIAETEEQLFMRLRASLSQIPAIQHVLVD